LGWDLRRCRRLLPPYVVIGGSHATLDVSFGVLRGAMLAVIGCQSAQDTNSAAGIPLGQGSQGPSGTTEQFVKVGDNQKTCEELATEINGLGQSPPASSNNTDVAGDSASSYLGMASSLLGSGASAASSLFGTVPVIGQVASSAMQAIAMNRAMGDQKAAMEKTMNYTHAAQTAAQRRGHLMSIFQEKKC
jgi:hypothetical protein